MSPFDQKKDLILREIAGNSADTPDASPKGTIDELCLPLIATINANPDMVTTSLCSGRVSVFLEGVKEHVQIGAKGNEGRWLYVSHDPEFPTEWFSDIDFQRPDNMPPLSDRTRYILFKFEPLILHVKCRDSATARLLFSTAMSCGFRELGIGSNDVVGIRILIKLDIPIGFLHEDALILSVSEDYLRMVSKLSKDRFAENMRKMAQLEKAIGALEAIPERKVETKEERRERKIKEGMARRESVLAEKKKRQQEKEAEKAAEKKPEAST